MKEIIRLKKIVKISRKLAFKSNETKTSKSRFSMHQCAKFDTRQKFIGLFHMKTNFLRYKNFCVKNLTTVDFCTENRPDFDIMITKIAIKNVT